MEQLRNLLKTIPEYAMAVDALRRQLLARKGGGLC